MKPIFLLIACFTIALHPRAQDTAHIDFHPDLSWQGLLSLARQTKKLAFVDVYTDWCVPCRRMEQEVFTAPAVADSINQNFLAYRINAEKGEGIAVAKRYGITGYPYMIFVDGEGTLYYAVLGYRDVRQLIQDAAAAGRERSDPKPLGKWEAEYDANKKDLAWLRGYIAKRNKLRMDSRDLLDDFFSRLPPKDVAKAENLLLVVGTSGIDIGSATYQAVTRHFKEISLADDQQYHLQEKLLDQLEGAINRVLLKAMEDRDETLLARLTAAYGLFPTTVRGMPWYNRQDADKWRFIYYRQQQDEKKFYPVAVRYIQRYYTALSAQQVKRSDSVIYAEAMAAYRAKGLDAAALERMMPMLDHYFKTFTTTDHLEKLLNAANFVDGHTLSQRERETALQWARRAVSLQPNSSALEAEAKILYHLHHVEEALRTIHRSIAVAESDQEKARLNAEQDQIRHHQEI